MWVLKQFGLLKVSKETELGGIDLFKHNVSAYPEFVSVGFFSIFTRRDDNAPRFCSLTLCGLFVVCVVPPASTIASDVGTATERK